MTMMESEVPVQIEIIGNHEIALLNDARALADVIAKRLQTLSHDPRVVGRAVGSDTPGPFEIGLMFGHYEDISEAIFQALNVTHNYGQVPMTYEQVHNRSADA